MHSCTRERSRYMLPKWGRWTQDYERVYISIYWKDCFFCVLKCNGKLDTNGRSLFPNLVLSSYILGCCHVQPWSFQDLYSTCHQKLLVVSKVEGNCDWCEFHKLAEALSGLMLPSILETENSHDTRGGGGRIDTCSDIMQTLQSYLSNVTKYQCCNHPNCRVDCKSSAAYQLSSHTRYLHQ